MNPEPETASLLSLGAVFTVLFVTLGPLKVLGPYVQMTRDADEGALRQIAVRSFAIALFAVVVGGFAGRTLMTAWAIPIPTMTVAGGIIFFLVGLRAVLEQYQPLHSPPPTLPSVPMAAAMRITFPTVVTPYGIAALIILLANSPSNARTLQILGILVAVMLLNLAAMLYARRMMGGVTLMALQITGAVLGVLQVGLATEMIGRGLRGLGVLH